MISRSDTLQNVEEGDEDLRRALRKLDLLEGTRHEQKKAPPQNPFIESRIRPVQLASPKFINGGPWNVLPAKRETSQQYIWYDPADPLAPIVKTGVNTMTFIRSANCEPVEGRVTWPLGPPEAPKLLAPMERVSCETPTELRSVQTATSSRVREFFSRH